MVVFTTLMMLHFDAAWKTDNLFLEKQNFTLMSPQSWLPVHISKESYKYTYSDKKIKSKSAIIGLLICLGQ